MSIFLTRSATSQWSSYPIVLRRLGGPRSRSNDIKLIRENFILFYSNSLETMKFLNIDNSTRSSLEFPFMYGLRRHCTRPCLNSVKVAQKELHSMKCKGKPIYFLMRRSSSVFSENFKPKIYTIVCCTNYYSSKKDFEKVGEFDSMPTSFTNQKVAGSTPGSAVGLFGLF